LGSGFLFSQDLSSLVGVEEAFTKLSIGKSGIDLPD